MPITPPDPVDPTVPTDSYLVEQAQAEFRALKAYMQGAAPYIVTGGIISCVGDIIWSAVSTRLGCLPANGAAVSRSTYAGLFAAIGVTFGAGNGSTTFNVPDLRGRSLVGFDSGNASGRMNTLGIGGMSAAAVGNVGGLATHVLTTAELATHTHANTLTDAHHTHTFTAAAHNHGVNDPLHSHSISPNLVINSTVSLAPIPSSASGLYGNATTTSTAATGITLNPTTSTGTNSSDASNISITNAPVGTSTAHNIVQPGMVMYPYIKT